MQDYIPYGRQDINQQDIDAVVAILKSDYLTQGPAIARFEQLVADYCGVKYAVAVASATAGLHIACLSAGLGSGDRLWTVPNTFVASANCALYCGAEVDFVDIDPKTYNLSISALAAKLAIAAEGGKLPKILIPVHFAGQSCDMSAIGQLAQQYGFQVIEDAAHGIGGRYRDRPIGCCEFSELTVFSFHPVKIITTAEGGMVLTNREDLYETLIRLRSHGITRDSRFIQGDLDGPWYYQQLELGYHYRMTDLQAALGASQMNRLDAFVKRRHELVERYNVGLKDLPLTTPYQSPETYPSWHLYVIRLELDCIKLTHREVFETLRAAGIGVNLHYIPVHTQPYYQNLGFQWGQFPEAEQYYREAISIPLYSGLTHEQQDRIMSVLGEILQ
jgi:UDP-4-amino-4,6-dideoxy-N-acetyl-beta-L-altrosamine transaminase